MEHPFSEQEKRFVVAEALKSSRVPLEMMLAILEGGNGQPEWTEMFVPAGRTISQCMATLHELRASYSPVASNTALPLPLPLPLPHPSSNKRKSGTSELLDPSSAGPASKRRQSGTAITREIQPRLLPNGDPVSHTASPAPTGRKRGRPSKAVLEQRHAEALARGDVFGPTPSGAKGRLSTSGKFTPIAPTPAAEAPALEPSPALSFGGQQADTSSWSDSAGKKATESPTKLGEGPSPSEPAPESMGKQEKVKPETGIIGGNMGTVGERRDQIAAPTLPQPATEASTARSEETTTHTHPKQTNPTHPNPTPSELPSAPETRHAA